MDTLKETRPLEIRQGHSRTFRVGMFSNNETSTVVQNRGCVKVKTPKQNWHVYSWYL